MNTAYDDKNPAHLRERADALEAQMNGRSTQYLASSGEWHDRIGSQLTPFQPEFRYRPKPWTLPEPPAGMRWHKPEAITEEMHKRGYRPLIVGEEYHNGDEYFSNLRRQWDRETHASGVIDEYTSPCRTLRPLPSLMPGPEYHNPEGVSLAQVGEGHRLLTKEEQRQCEKLSRVHKGLRIWCCDDTWSDADTSGVCSGYTYRVPLNWQHGKPAPQPEPRLWDCAEDVPGPVCWLKTPLGNASLILHVAKEGVGMAIKDGTGNFTWAELAKCEYSTDRQYWQPCHKQP